LGWKDISFGAREAEEEKISSRPPAHCSNSDDVQHINNNNNAQDEKQQLFLFPLKRRKLTINTFFAMRCDALRCTYLGSNRLPEKKKKCLLFY